MRPHLLVEPWARSRVAEIEDELTRSGVDYSLEVVDGSTQDAAARARDEGRLFLVAVGDDRSANAVVNALMGESGPLVEGAGIGILPARESGLARTFGMPQDPVLACRTLRGDEWFDLDVALASTDEGGSRWFVVASEVGFGARQARAGERLRRRIGRSGDLLGFWGALAASGDGFRISAGRRTWEGQAWDVVVGNCQFIGGLRHSPRSFPGDGTLDVLILTGSKSAAFRRLPEMRRGEHVPSPEVTEMSGSRIRIEADGRVPVHVDGVVFGDAPVEYSLVPQALRLKV